MPGNSSTLSPVDLIAAQVDSETLVLPTGSCIFSRGSDVDAIYAVRRGSVELHSDTGEKICYRSGELFSFQDIAWREVAHRGDAVALTPVEIIRLDRIRFLNLVHNHPTLALLLLGQQHRRLREQRASGSCCY